MVQETINKLHTAGYIFLRKSEIFGDKRGRNYRYVITQSERFDEWTIFENFGTLRERNKRFEELVFESDCYLAIDPDDKMLIISLDKLLKNTKLHIKK
jgi:hypothetical protein